MRFNRPGFLSLCALVCALPVEATTVVAMSPEDLAVTADAVIIGRVEAITPRWVDRILVTDVTVRVREWVKGDGGDTLVVTLPGGVDTNREYPIAMDYPGAPRAQQGEDVFLFLVKDEPFGLIVAGFSQGKYSIVESSGMEYVSRDLTEIRLSTGAGIVRGGPTAPTPLEAFRGNVKSAIAAGRDPK